MLDTIKVGLLRLDTRGKPYGYMRIVSKEDENAPVQSYFQIPLHVVFDREGYNSYKELVDKKNPEFKTWVHDVTIKVPPHVDHAQIYPNAGHEWFLGNLRDIAMQSSSFPPFLKEYLEESIQEYIRVKKEIGMGEEIVEDDYDPPPMDKAQTIAASRAIHVYGMLQRSRFDPGRPDRPGEFALPPFIRPKEEKNAKELIEEITDLVSNYVWKNPKVSKYSETEGAGLKIKLSVLFLECFYKEQIRFVKSRLKMDTQRIRIDTQRKSKTPESGSSGPHALF